MNPSVHTGPAVDSKVWSVVIGITRDLFYLFMVYLTMLPIPQII
jgi:hypothetical protein